MIAPGVEHRVEPATDATFFIQFYRAPEAPMVPGLVEVDSRRRSGPWEHRAANSTQLRKSPRWWCRQYVDVVQDELLEPYFNFAPGFIDWQAHIESVFDYWCHVLLYTPGYEIDVIEVHRPLHDADGSLRNSSIGGSRSSTTPSTADGPARTPTKPKSGRRKWHGHGPTIPRQRNLATRPTPLSDQIAVQLSR